MPLFTRHNRSFVRPHLWLLALVGIIVPRRLRAAWRQEWEAELRHREALLAEWDNLNWQSKLDLLRRSTSAFWDALWLLPKRWEDDMWQDLRYGARMLSKRPGFTLLAVLTLAVGIGASTAIFSAVNAVLFRALPYQEPAQLMQVSQRFYPRPNMDTMPVTPANFLDWQAQSHTVATLAAYRLTNLNLSGAGNPERIRAAQASPNLFAVLGAEPLLGRTFLAGEDAAASEPAVVVSYPLWQRRFNGDPNIIGQTIKANDKAYTIIGVMPEGFRFPIGWVASEVEMWGPLVFAPGETSNRTAMTLDVIARLHPGVTQTAAQTHLDGVARQLEQAYPQTNKDWGANLMPLTERGVRNYRNLFWFLSLAVGVVLLIACANVANLLLARGLERQKELTIRAALGAPRFRLLRQLLTEGVLLASLGGLLGVLLAKWGISVLTSFATTTNMPDLKTAGLNARVLVFSLALSWLTGLLFSLFPALLLTPRTLAKALQEEGRGMSESRRRQRLKTALVVGELALTLALLVCAGMLLRSFQSYMAVAPGFVADNVLTMRLTLPAEKYAQDTQWITFFARVEETIKAIPGVVTAAGTSSVPMEEAGDVLRYQVEGKPEPGPQQPRLLTEHIPISPDYFRAVGIQLRQGRALADTDVAGQPLVAVINETLAKRDFPDKNPIGERLRLLGDVNRSVQAGSTQPVVEIVGVVADTKDYNFYLKTPPILYVPMRQSPVRTMSLVVKTAVEPTSVMAEIRRRLLTLDPDQPVYNVRTLTQLVHEKHQLIRFNTLLLTVFAVIALALSLIGLYGVIAYAVGQRAKEFGIRLALGAQAGDIFKLVLRTGAGLTLGGLVLGGALAFPALRFLARTLKQSMNLELLGNGPLLLVVVSAMVACVAFAACYLPARRATKVDPMVALRHE